MGACGAGASACSAGFSSASWFQKIEGTHQPPPPFTTTPTLAGGHYTAMCRVPQQGGGEEEWFSFNDEQVARVPPSQASGAQRWG